MGVTQRETMLRTRKEITLENQLYSLRVESAHTEEGAVLVTVSDSSKGITIYITKEEKAKLLEFLNENE